MNKPKQYLQDIKSQKKYFRMQVFIEKKKSNKSLYYL